MFRWNMFQRNMFTLTFLCEHSFSLRKIPCKVKVKSAYELIGPSGRSFSRFQYHEVTRSMDGMLVHRRVTPLH